MTLGNRYRLDALIGGGGMGEVWKAHDEVLNRVVAIKVIRDHLADDPTIRERLRIEAQLAGGLHHPSIVEVYDYGEHEADGRTTPYLVMALIEGRALSRVLKENIALPVGETMAVVTEMALALQTAHEAGIVHRDLKPANVMLTKGARVMILDFGIARSISGEALTQTGALIGTADYLSPEQAAGRQATFASDMYALGIVAYTCLTGAPPFHRETDIATAMAHLQAPIPDLPDELAAQGVGPLVHSLLAKEPSERPSAGEVAEIASIMATTVPATASEEPEHTQPVTAPVTSPVAPPAPAATATMGVISGPSTEAQPVGLSQPGATALMTEQRRRPPRRAVMVSSAVLAAAVIVFALMTMVGRQVEVPDVSGMTSVEAASTIAKAGLTVKTTEVDAAGRSVGEVVSQLPKPGTDVDKASTVVVAIATGFVEIPDSLVGMTYDDAVNALSKLGLKASRTNIASSETAGTVIKVSPATRAETGATVALSVAYTPAPVDTKDDKKKDDKKKKKKD